MDEETPAKHDVDKPPEPPSEDVAAKQDPEHSEADFLRDLGKATRRESSEPGRGSSKT